jgi:hypothetical protein
MPGRKKSKTEAQPAPTKLTAEEKTLLSKTVNAQTEKKIGQKKIQRVLGRCTSKNAPFLPEMTAVPAGIVGSTVQHFLEYIIPIVKRQATLDGKNKQLSVEHLRRAMEFVRDNDGPEWVSRLGEGVFPCKHKTKRHRK